MSMPQNAVIATRALICSHLADGYSLSSGERAGVRVIVNLISSWPVSRSEQNKILSINRQCGKPSSPRPSPPAAGGEGEEHFGALLPRAALAVLACPGLLSCRPSGALTFGGSTPGIVRGIAAKSAARSP